MVEIVQNRETQALIRWFEAKYKASCCKVLEQEYGLAVHVWFNPSISWDKYKQLLRDVVETSALLPYLAETTLWKGEIRLHRVSFMGPLPRG